MIIDTSFEMGILLHKVIVRNSLCHWKQWNNVHANAFGQAIKISNIDKLYEYANEHLSNVNFNEGYYEADFIVKGNCSYIADMIEDLEKGRDCFGQQNDEPMVIIEDITIDPTTIQVIGKNSDTLKFSFNGITYVKFKAKDLIAELSKYNSKISIVVAGRTNVNYWGGKSTPQILIEEIEIKESNNLDF